MPGDLAMWKFLRSGRWGLHCSALTVHRYPWPRQSEARDILKLVVDTEIELEFMEEFNTGRRFLPEYDCVPEHYVIVSWRSTHTCWRVLLESMRTGTHYFHSLPTRQ